MTWRQVCEDKALADLPYKIELDRMGRIIMSPAGKKHSKFQIKIQRHLVRLLPQGDPLPECAIETTEGIRVADVAWVSDARWNSMNPDDVSCTIAPEICVEILSSANTMEEMLGTPDRPGKRELYFHAGAEEFWICDESGRMSFFNPSGSLVRSELCPEFPEHI